MSPRGVPNRAPGQGGTPQQAAALRRQFAHLADTEAMPVYQEMLAAAGARVAAETALPRWANGQVAEKTAAQIEAHNTGQTHGRISTYQAGCRCEDCRAVSAARAREYRARKAQAS